MSKQNRITLGVVSVLLINCSEEQTQKQNFVPAVINQVVDSIPFVADPGFPVVKNLDTFRNTTFVCTPQSHTISGSNVIYCSTLLFAWNEIEKSLGFPFEISPADEELMLLAHSSSHEGTLREEEIETKVTLSNSTITTRAWFRKSLPFELELERFTEPLNFKNELVQSFGFLGRENEMAELCEILYYKNDNHFALKLQPKDKEHEIILYTSPDANFGTFDSLLEDLYHRSKSFANQHAWKKNIQFADIVKIPILSFNIEHNYDSLEGNFFLYKSSPWKIITAYQRIAFILDEKGAEAESESKVTVEFSGEEVSEEGEDEKPKPKKMIFDQPFLVMLKRKDCDNPYFAAWISNTELLKLATTIK